RVCSGDMGVLVIGIILPLTFIDGGTPAVINKSEPPFSTIRRSSFSNSIVVRPCASRGYVKPAAGACLAAGLNPTSASRPETVDLEVFRGLGFLARRLTADDALGNQGF